MATIRGSMKNRVWIAPGDIVLLGLRDFGDDLKCDIILKYFDEEAKELQELGELPEHIKIAEGGIGLSDDEGAMYGGESDEGEGDKDDEEVKKEVDIDAI